MWPLFGGGHPVWSFWMFKSFLLFCWNASRVWAGEGWMGLGMELELHFLERLSWICPSSIYYMARNWRVHKLLPQKPVQNRPWWLSAWMWWAQVFTRLSYEMFHYKKKLWSRWDLKMSWVFRDPFWLQKTNWFILTNWLKFNIYLLIYVNFNFNFLPVSCLWVFPLILSDLSRNFF